MILHTSLQELRQNINQRLSPKKTPHTLPWRVSYGVSFMNLLEKIDHVIMAMHWSLWNSIKHFLFTIDIPQAEAKPKHHEADTLWMPFTEICIALWPLSQIIYVLKIQFCRKKCSNSYFKDQIRPQFCTSLDSSAVKTCAKLWPYQIF